MCRRGSSRLGPGAAPSFLSDPSFATDAGNPVFLWKLCLGSAMQVFIELLYFFVAVNTFQGITGQHPMCPRCCMILAGVTLKTAGGTLDWLCSTRLSLGMWPLIQIKLVW